MTAQGWACQVVAVVLPLALEVALQQQQQQQGLQAALQQAPALRLQLQAAHHMHGTKLSQHEGVGKGMWLRVEGPTMFLDAEWSTAASSSRIGCAWRQTCH
jgi:type II secretory pathway pseudopilin PulG